MPALSYRSRAGLLEGMSEDVVVLTLQGSHILDTVAGDGGESSGT